MYSVTSASVPCTNCGSPDNWVANESHEIQGFVVTVRREYCNYCTEEHVQFYIEGDLVHKDHRKGMGVKYGKKEATTGA